MANTARVSHTKSGKDADKFRGNLVQAAKSESNFLDSASAASAISDSISGENSLAVPEKLAQLFDELSESGRVGVTTAILDAVTSYEAMHGQTCPPDLMDQFIHFAYGNTREGYKASLMAAGIMDSAILDNATNINPDNTALQANRSIVSITRAAAASIPWVSALPTDISSGLANLIIVNHIAGGDLGGYALSDNMDGVNSGKRFFGSNRVDTATNASANAGANSTHIGQLTSVQTDSENCAAVGGTAVAVKLIKGRAKVYIGGHVVAGEVNDSSVTSTVSGSVTLSGVTYQIGGTINTDTGAYSLTCTPLLNLAIPVLVESYVDFNRQTSLIAEINIEAPKYQFVANPLRASATVGIDSRTQFANEANLDPMSELMKSVQIQLGNEKHYTALQYARRLAKNNVATFAVDTWLATGAQTRAQSIENISIPIQVVSQQMAIDTNITGVTHIYVGKVVKSWLNTLIAGGRFIPSGIRDQPNIHRVGTLDGTYEVYYSPDQPETTDGSGITSAEILCIGQAMDVARSGVVTGQAVAPIILPVGVTKYGDQGVTYFEKAFMTPNPHTPSAKCFATITLTGLK